MKQIIEKRIIYGQETVNVLYISIDELYFRWSADCKKHEEYIKERKNQYRQRLTLSVYTPAQLRIIYANHEANRADWMNAPLKQFRYYNGSQYALSSVLLENRINSEPGNNKPAKGENANKEIIHE